MHKSKVWWHYVDHLNACSTFLPADIDKVSKQLSYRRKTASGLYYLVLLFLPTAVFFKAAIMFRW